MRTTANKETVEKSLKTVNKKKGYKLEFKRCEQKGKWFHFTIKSKKSGIPGARYSTSGRNINSASWHAHGYLFDEILIREPDAIIWSGGTKITKSSGNWQDSNIGSTMTSTYYSQTSIL